MPCISAPQKNFTASSSIVEALRHWQHALFFLFAFFKQSHTHFIALFCLPHHFSYYPNTSFFTSYFLSYQIFLKTSISILKNVGNDNHKNRIQIILPFASLFLYSIFNIYRNCFLSQNIPAVLLYRHRIGFAGF